MPFRIAVGRNQISSSRTRRRWLGHAYFGVDNVGMGSFRFAIVAIMALPALAQQVTSPRFEAQFTAREVQWRNEMLPVIEVQQSTHVDAEASTGV